MGASQKICVFVIHLLPFLLQWTEEWLWLHPLLTCLDWPEAKSGSPANCSLPLACIALLNNSPSLHYMTKYSFVSNIWNHSEETTFLYKIPCIHIPVLAEAHKAHFSLTLGKLSLWIITALKLWLCTIPSWNSRLAPITTVPALPPQQTHIVPQSHSHWQLQQPSTDTLHCTAGLVLPSPGILGSHGWENATETTNCRSAFTSFIGVIPRERDIKRKWVWNRNCCLL